MIPLIDCSPIAEGEFENVRIEDFNKVAQAIGSAMTGIGMCNLINHGISKEKIEKALQVSKEFFNLPTTTKMKYRKLDIKKSFSGYIGPGEEIVNEKEKNSTELRESWDIRGREGCDEKNFPIEEVPNFKDVMDDIRNDLDNTAKKILRCIEIYLHLDEGFLISTHKNLADHSIKCQTILRSINYYTLNGSDFIPNAIRCGEHSDWGSITLLMQDMVGGLEVKTSKGEWIDVIPVDNAILLNSGQLLEYWTGGRFHAALHRVLIKTDGRIAREPRQSFIYFVNPDSSVNVFPVIPVLAETKEQFVKFNKKPVNGYDHFQRLIEYSYAN